MLEFQELNYFDFQLVHNFLCEEKHKTLHQILTGLSNNTHFHKIIIKQNPFFSQISKNSLIVC